MRKSVRATAVVPTWEELRATLEKSPTTQRIKAEAEERAAGRGPAHQDNRLRLFGAREEDVRVTFYRDHAGWCPYCQKLWIMLEEKQIPYRVEKINMRSYGDKPKEFLAKIPSGLLPVVEIDGQMITESLVIMQILEREFPERVTLPEDKFDLANKLLKLERQLFSDWCGLVFRPSLPGPLGARAGFEKTLDEVDKALGATPGPWFLGGENPGIVDFQYVSHVERMNASVLYWKGLQMRGTTRWANLEKWLLAFEARPSYQATKSDYYTHIMDIPPQYGPGYPDKNATVDEAVGVICGETSLRLPVKLSADGLEPVPDAMNRGEEDARHEAAYKIAKNAENIVKFACRGMGEEGAKRFQAPLADPYAQPNMNYSSKVDESLRVVVQALIDGTAVPTTRSTGVTSDVKSLRKCLAYLRDRVGVPRDMSYPAAMQLRAHLNWRMETLS